MKKFLPELPQGSLKIGEGRISAYLCFLISGLTLLTALAFMFPSYLTTPELREVYNADAFRGVIGGALMLAAALGAFALSQRAERRFASAGLVVAAVTLLLGGPNVAQGSIEPSAFYIGLDWFIIGLITTGGAFVVLEKLAPLRREQPVLREDWLLDMKYFLLMHLIIGVFLFAGNYIVHEWFDWMVVPGIGEAVRSLPLWAEFILLVFAVDFLQYWIHRLYHENSFFWKVHSVHHSTETMDWLAGSRLNILEPLVVRTVGLLVMATFGFEQGTISAFILFTSFHATFIHANCGIDLSKIENLFVTPKYHHWHHADAEDAINKNYAVYFSFLDRMFGTQYNPAHWPDGYGVIDGKPPKGLIRAQLHPITG